MKADAIKALPVSQDAVHTSDQIRPDWTRSDHIGPDDDKKSSFAPMAASDAAAAAA